MAKDKIRVNSILPGGIMTRLHEARDSEEEYQERMKRITARCPLGHLGEPDEPIIEDVQFMYLRQVI